MSYRRQRVAEAANDLAKRTQLHLERISSDNAYDAAQRRVTDRYGQAIEQLGNQESALVRVGGMYSLMRLAQDHRDLRQPAVDLLCAYLRVPFEPPLVAGGQSRKLDRILAEGEGEAADGSSLDPNLAEGVQELQVRLTAQRLLRRYLAAGGDVSRIFGGSIYESSWPGTALDLTGAALVDFDFSGCRASSAIFRQASFFGNAMITDAIFDGSADFRGANFTGAADFRRASFGGEAEFEGACFNGPALLTAALFSHSAYFGGYDEPDGVSFMEEARFDRARFQEDAIFRRARFDKRADFTSVQFAAKADFGMVTFGGDTVFSTGNFGGDSTFGRAHFTGPPRQVGLPVVDFRKSTFRNNAYLAESVWDAPTDFGDASFSCEAFFASSQFNERVSFNGVHFGYETRFDGAMFKDSTFGGGIFEGSSVFWSAHFRGDADFSDAQFSQGATFDSAHFYRSAKFIKVKFHGDSAFYGANFEGAVDFRDAKISTAINEHNYAEGRVPIRDKRGNKQRDVRRWPPGWRVEPSGQGDNQSYLVRVVPDDNGPRSEATP